MESLPEKVKICECWARDGIQGEAEFIPTETKIGMIDHMARIGFKRIEATSFAHPKLVKQFADAVDVLKGRPIQPFVDATRLRIAIPQDNHALVGIAPIIAGE